MKDPRLQPKKARPIKHTQTKAGWWYEQKSGIDVFVQSETGLGLLGLGSWLVGWALYRMGRGR